MPGPLLTAASTLQCPHGGTVVITPGSPRSSAGGAPMVTTGDVFTVVGCVFTLPGPVPSPCVTVQWIIGNPRLSSPSGQALDMSSVGICLAATGAPQGPVVIQSAQQSNVAGM
jgi:hypothetical protein